MQLSVECGAFVALVMVFLTFAQPSAAWGRALPISISLLIVLLLLAASLVSGLVFSPILLRPSLARVILFLGLTSVSCFFASQQIIGYLDQEHNLSSEMGTSMVQYFCITKFDAIPCVREINMCPKCVLKIDRWQRDQIAAKLNAADKSPPELKAWAKKRVETNPQ